MARIVTLTIDENGDATVETDGYNGKGCDAIQKAFGNALGRTVASTKKLEYSKPCQGQQKVNAGGR